MYLHIFVIPLVKFMDDCTIIVGTTVLFVAYKYGFLSTFKHWERNPHYNIEVYRSTFVQFNYCTFFQQ
jgi:hypothetical protein